MKRVEELTLKWIDGDILPGETDELDRLLAGDPLARRVQVKRFSMRVRSGLISFGLIVVVTCSHAAPPESERADTLRGPLTVHPSNPRYFAAPDGRAVWLTGSHAWATVQERGVEDSAAHSLPSHRCRVPLTDCQHNRLWRHRLT
jgi:hypothetical protein